jgi:hypothetical protein
MPPRACAGAVIVVAPTVATVAKIASVFFMASPPSKHPDQQRRDFSMVAAEPDFLLI